MNKKQRIESKKYIESFTGMTHDDHAYFIYECGLNWLKRNRRTHWETSRIFWDWYKLQWDLRNFELANKLKECNFIEDVHKGTASDLFLMKHEQYDKIFPARPLRNSIMNELKLSK